MSHGQADLLTPATNFAIVQLPGRQFPGVVFQGDSLNILAGEIAEIRRLIKNGDEPEELEGVLDEVSERLESILVRYKEVCLAVKGKLPF
jgi:hypothetical protein